MLKKSSKKGKGITGLGLNEVSEGSSSFEDNTRDIDFPKNRNKQRDSTPHIPESIEPKSPYRRLTMLPINSDRRNTGTALPKPDQSPRDVGAHLFPSLSEQPPAIVRTDADYQYFKLQPVKAPVEYHRLYPAGHSRLDQIAPEFRDVFLGFSKKVLLVSSDPETSSAADIMLSVLENYHTFR